MPAGCGLLASAMLFSVYSDEEEEDAGFEHVSLPEGKIGAKKMRKLQEKEEKRRMREVQKGLNYLHNLFTR